MVSELTETEKKFANWLRRRGVPHANKIVESMDKSGWVIYSKEEDNYQHQRMSELIDRTNE